VTFRSKPLLTVCRDEFRKRKPAPRVPLKDLLKMDPEAADFRAHKTDAAGKTHVVCVNGNESAGWQTEAAFVAALGKAGVGVTVIDTRGVGKLRPTGLQEASPQLKGKTYTDPLNGVEENISYNAFLLGKNLLGMRAADVLKAVAQIRAESKPERVVLCGRRDGAFVALFAAAVAADAVQAVAVEGMPASYWPLFDPEGTAFNAASILPRLLRDFGDLPAVVAAVAPRKVLTDKRFAADPAALLDWLKT
jgi:pimeloyl-ACP methyl ester carboxylesterase